MLAKCFLCCICISITITIPVVVCSLQVQVDGRIEFGPNWKYEHPVKPLETSSIRSYVKSKNSNTSGEEKEGPKIIDIILKNDKYNPRLIAEARIYDKDLLRGGNATQTEDKNDDINEYAQMNTIENNLRTFTEEVPTNKGKIQFYKETSAEATDDAKIVEHKRIDSEQSTGLIIISEERTNLSPSNGATVMWLEETPKKDRKRNRKNRNSTPESLGKAVQNIERKNKGKDIKNVNITDDNIASENNATGKRIEVEEFTHPMTEMNETPPDVPELYVRAHYVRDDPKIKEFTKHVYEQSIKTFQAIKEKLTSYDIKNEADYLMRGYEEKFGDFVRETQNHKIRTRLGNEKVILNTLDTSNRILDRLVNHLIEKMAKKGILRTAGAENVILKELEKKKELENKHICNKMQICRSSDSLTNFIIDILTIVLGSDDRKVTEIRDACTEVLKNTDFRSILDPDTEKRFQKGISDLERYDVKLIRPIFGMIKNILVSRNMPIKVVGPEDTRVNKTVAFMELINNFDKKLPPNEKNILEWNDMRNSFKEWKEGKRKDVLDLVQHLTDHMLSPGVQVNDGTMFDRNVNTILGF